MKRRHPRYLFLKAMRSTRPRRCLIAKRLARRHGLSSGPSRGPDHGR
jgi:hypothetical protein